MIQEDIIEIINLLLEELQAEEPDIDDLIRLKMGL